MAVLFLANFLMLENNESRITPELEIFIKVGRDQHDMITTIASYFWKYNVLFLIFYLKINKETFC